MWITPSWIPQKKLPLPFSKRISPMPNQKCQECFVWKPDSGVSLRLHSNLLYQKFVMMANRTRGARGGLKLRRTLHESPRHRLAPLGNPERKTLLAFLIWRGWNFFWKRKGCFSFGVLPKKFLGRCGGSKYNAAEAKQKLFCGRKRILLCLD